MPRWPPPTAHRVDRGVEGQRLQTDARALARTEANQDTGRSIGPQAVEILPTIDTTDPTVALRSGAAAGGGC